METEQRAPTMEWLAGLVAFATVAFALPLAMAGTPSHDDRLRALIQMGGAAQFLILGVAAMVAAVQALWVVFALRMRPALAAVLPLGPLLVFGLGTLGFLNGMRGALRAVAEVAPVDHAVITFAAMGEASCCIVLGTALASLLWVGQGAGLCVLATGRTAPAARAPLLVTAAGSLGLGVWSTLDVVRVGGFARAFQAATRFESERLDVILAAAARSEAQWGAGALGVAAVSALVTLALAGWSMTRAKAPVAAGACVVGVGLTALCVAGVLAARRAQGDELQQLFAASHGGPDLLEFAGVPTQRRADVTLDLDGPHVRDGFELREALERAALLQADDGVMLGVAVTKGVHEGALGDLLLSANAAGCHTVELLGRAPQSRMPGLPPLLELVHDNVPRDVGAQLLLSSDSNRGPAARIGASGVDIDGKVLTFAEAGPVDPEPGHDAVVELRTATLEQFVRGLVTLRHAGYRPVMILAVRAP